MLPFWFLINNTTKRTKALNQVKKAPKNNLVKWKSVLSRLLKPTMDALDHFDVGRGEGGDYFLNMLGL